MNAAAAFVAAILGFIVVTAILTAAVMCALWFTADRDDTDAPDETAARTRFNAAFKEDK